MNARYTMAPSARRPLSGTGVLRIPGRKTQQTKIATWNVRTMSEAGKLRNIQLEMTRLNIDILGVSEARWPGSGTNRGDNFTTYYSGTSDNIHKNGVAIIIKSSLNNNVQSFIPLSDRIILIKLRNYPRPINIIQVYAPTADRPQDEIDDFYQQIREAIKYTKKYEVNLILGDFNAKVGLEITPGITGGHGLGVRNERGERLIDFCQEENFLVTNTWYKLPKRRLYTWKSPADKNGQLVRNQIDYILINQRFKNAIKWTKTYPSADCNTDHTLLSTCINVKLKRTQIPPTTRKINTDLLKGQHVREAFAVSMNQNIKKCICPEETLPIDQQWSEVENAMQKTGMEKLTQPTNKRQDWMTNEILELMNKRRDLKNRNEYEYKQIHKLITRKIKVAKERWMEERCEEIEELQRKHDEYAIHKKIKEINYKHQKHNNNYSLRSSENRVLYEKDDVKKEWQAYIEQLFEDDRTQQPQITIKEPGLPILKIEVEHAIRQTKSNKAPGPDRIPVEFFKLIDENNLKTLTNVFNHIYNTGNIPRNWYVSKFIPIPKTKQNPSPCSNFRLISLMNHSLKILLRVILNRIQQKCEEIMSGEQFGFRKGLGTREALFAMQTLLQRCWEVKRPVYICFIDYEKAFDRVQHNKLIDALMSLGIDEKDLRLITNLYWGQHARIAIQGDETDEIAIKRGVRQGCVLSPTLFNVYTENIFRAALNNSEGIHIGGESVNNIRFADDTAILAENQEELQSMLDKIHEESLRWGLTINKSKTKFMVVNKVDVGPVGIALENTSIERVERFKYLGSWINDRMDPDMEIKIRVQQARAAFLKVKTLLTNPHLNLHIRERFARCYSWSVLLYGCETWTLGIRIMNHIEAFEMWTYRRILKIPWTDRITNEVVLNRMGHNRQLLSSIKRRKLEYLGHILRNDKYRLLQLILNGKIEGTRWIGRKKLSWLRNLRHWTGLDVEQLMHAAHDRNNFRQIIDMAVTNA